LFLSCILILTACASNVENTASPQETPTFYEEELLPSLTYTLAVHRQENDEWVDPAASGKVEKGEIIRLTATVTNTGENDYTFHGNPCDSELFVALHKDGKKIAGSGNITPDACIEPQLTHTLRAGAELAASGEFDLAKAEPGVYTISASYAKETFEKEIEVIESNK